MRKPGNMKKLFALFITFVFSTGLFSQLQDVKILIPKEIGYTTYDFIQFLPGEKYFVVLANSLSVYNTETCEIIDDYELSLGAKNLSVSRDGKYILATVNTELFIFSFADQKLKLLGKLSTPDFIKDQPNAQYYGMLPINGCFFLSKPGQVYVSIGSFSLIYDFEKKLPVSSYAFPNTDYIIHSVEYAKKEAVILAKMSGTVNSIVMQSLSDLSKFEEVTVNRTTSYKIKVRDSLLFCFNLDLDYIMNLENKKVLHEVRAPKFDYSGYGSDVSNEYTKELNKRVAITRPDTINFSQDEYVYDMDFVSKSGYAFYATIKGIKVIDLKTKKLVMQDKGITTNLKLSASGKRMICNGFTSYKALRVYEPERMTLIAERAAMGNVIAYTNISPGNKWLYTGCGSSGFLWNIASFTKYAEIRDISGSDSSFVANAFFLNDSEIVVNSGNSMKNLNLAVYNIPKKKYSRVIKKGIFTMASGFMNGEFYYCDYQNLHIIDLKTMKEDKYPGMFSLAAAPQYHIVEFTNDLVFVPESGKYKIINRKTKKVEYESEAWSMNTRVSISPDNKFVITAGQIRKKKTFNGAEVEIPTNAIVRISMEQKKVVNDYAETFNPYDFKLKDQGKTIGIWYLKHEYGAAGNEKESVYSEYDLESGREKFSKTLVKSPEVLSYNFTSDSGKYFALLNYTGNYFKVFNSKGDMLMDLSDLNISAPRCFFIERSDLLIITSSVNSLATFVDLKNKKVMGQLANAGGDEYFMVTKELNYLGSKEFVKNIRFKYQSEMFSFDQFDAYLNQPHKVLRAFKCSDSALIHAYEAAYLNRMKVLGLKPHAGITFSVLPAFQQVIMKEEKSGKVNFSLSANKGQNSLLKLEVLNNGTSVYSETIGSDQSSRFESNLSFETSSGINRFEFIIRDSKGLESPRITRFYNNTNMVQPDLYLVVIASEKFKNTDFDLSYALKDASDVANTMANSKSFRNVYTRKLVNQNFVSDTVKNLKSFFARAGVNDLVMVFYAGHGYLDSDLSYYFPTYYTDFSDPKINSVGYNSFEKLFREMKPIRKLMFIDACFSGEVDTEEITPYKKGKEKKDSSRTASTKLFTQSTALEMSKAIFTDLRHNSGVTVISSAGGTEAAYEDEKWNNGLFTYCLINGMKNLKADSNHDKKVTLNELQKYVSEEVNRISEGKQTPTYRVENTVLDYELW
jgi:hypothetical protein